MAATVEPIGGGKVFECLFAIEEQKLDLCSKGRAQCQDPGHFNEQPSARSAVICSNKANRVEALGVVVRAKKELCCLFFLAGSKACNQIYKCHFPARSLVGKFRACYGPTGRLQLFDDIKSRFLQRFRTGGSGGATHQMPDVCKRILARKIFPKRGGSAKPTPAREGRSPGTQASPRPHCRTPS